MARSRSVSIGRWYIVRRETKRDPTQSKIYGWCMTTVDAVFATTRGAAEMEAEFRNPCKPYEYLTLSCVRSKQSIDDAKRYRAHRDWQIQMSRKVFEGAI